MAITPACLPGRTHVSTVTDIGEAFHPRVRSYCHICRQTWEYDVQTVEQANHTFRIVKKRPPAPETWKVIGTPAHIHRANRSHIA